jgi:hypothetical protein
VEPFHYQPQQSVLNRHDGQRQTACIRYMSAPQRSHVMASSDDVAAAGPEPGVRELSAETTGVTTRRGTGF